MTAKFFKVSALSITTLFLSGVAFANLEQVKLYKEAFPDEEKPKCMNCHVDKIPKKEDGKHDWNEYGQKVRKVKEKPDVETYKTAGKNPAASSD